MITKRDFYNFLNNKKHFQLLENIHILILAHGSEYYEHPERHNIYFQGDKRELYKKYLDAIPHHLWFSMNPYIDHEIRVKRMKTIANALHSNGVKMGAYAESMVVKEEKGLGSHRISKEPGDVMKRDREQYANI